MGTSAPQIAFSPILSSENTTKEPSPSPLARSRRLCSARPCKELPEIISDGKAATDTDIPTLAARLLPAIIAAYKQERLYEQVAAWGRPLLRRTAERFVAAGVPFEVAESYALKELLRFAEPTADQITQNFALTRAQIIAEARAEELLEARAALDAWDGRSCARFIVRDSKYTQEYLDAHTLCYTSGGGGYSSNRMCVEDRGILDHGFRPLDTEPGLVYRQAKQFGLIQGRSHWHKLPEGISAEVAAHDFAFWIWEQLKEGRKKYEESGRGVGWLEKMWHEYFIRDYKPKPSTDALTRATRETEDGKKANMVTLSESQQVKDIERYRPTSLAQTEAELNATAQKLASLSPPMLKVKRKDADWWQKHMQWALAESTADSEFDPANLSEVSRRVQMPRKTLVDRVARIRKAAIEGQRPN